MSAQLLIDAQTAITHTLTLAIQQIFVSNATSGVINTISILLHYNANVL